MNKRQLGGEYQKADDNSIFNIINLLAYDLVSDAFFEF